MDGSRSYAAVCCPGPRANQQRTTTPCSREPGGPDRRTIADNRMNQLIVQTSESGIERISNLIRQLDQPSDEKTAEER